VGDPTDEAGRALIAMLQQAAGLSSENCERATLLSTRLARELLAAEGRIKELESFPTTMNAPELPNNGCNGSSARSKTS
jgi:hypothetical protein